MTNRTLGALFALLLGAVLAACAPERRANAPSAAAAGHFTSAAPRASAARPFVYVAIGASDTFGYGVPDPATQGWVPRFAAMLPPGTRVVNLGVVGIILHHALAVDLPVALDAHPDLVTVWLAVNDLLAGAPLAAYQDDLHVLLTRLRQARGTHGHPRVLIGNLPDLTLVPSIAARLGADPAGTLARWNAAIAAEAQATGATLVDLAAQWQDLAAHPEYVGPDGFHPSVAGYARLAAIFAAYAR